MRLRLIFSGMLLFAWAAQAEPASEAPKCADLVVIGKILSYHPTEVADEPDTIVITWPWKLNIEIEEVLLGDFPPRRMRVTAILHMRYNSSIEHFLMYFTKTTDGYLLDRGRMSSEIVRDRAGHLVLPLIEPAADYEMLPDGWMPRDYLSRLRPLFFGHDGVWWMKTEAEDGHLVNDQSWEKVYRSGAKSDWLTEEDGWIVPKRGFRVADLKKMIAETTPRCSATH